MSMPRVSNVDCCTSTPLHAQGWIRTGPRWLRVVAVLLLWPLAASASAFPVQLPTLDYMQKKMASLAVPFEVNQGQFAPEVAFAARTFAGTLFVTRDGRIVHALTGKAKPKLANAREKALAENRASGQHDRIDESPRGPGWALVESLQGAGELAPTGSQASVTQVSRFFGSAANQTSTIATFDRVRLGQPWPGVSVELAAHGGNVEKLFTVAPGTDPKIIRMGVAGAKHLRLAKDGSLIAATGNGEVAFTPPFAFQQIGARRIEVPVRYALADTGYRFETGTYDHSQALVIDPLLQSTYLGGSGDDQAFALALDAGGNVLVAGYAESTDFPGTTGGWQATNGAGRDAFVARISNNLTVLSQSTYLGGSGLDQASALTVDAGGNVLVAGHTFSTNFPGTSGGAQPLIGGGSLDGFVARLSSSLTTLMRATYLGGNNEDEATALTRDANGNVLVAGFTSSTNFPGTASGAQAMLGGFTDAFVARLSSSLTTLVQATYLGGNSYDLGYALAIDASTNVFLAGLTYSSNLPGTAGGAQPIRGSGSDAFVSKLSGNLATLQQTTYLGGSVDELANALSLDVGGNVFVAGITSSTNFPGSTGGAQPSNGGGGFNDGFVARLPNSLTTLTQATYLGGAADDSIEAMTLDAGGRVAVLGSTSSINLPGVAGGAQPAYGGGPSDAFVARLSSSLATLVQSTYVGGSGDDRANAFVLDAGGNVLTAGFTDSTTFPVTGGGAQAANGGGNDAFVAKLTDNLQGLGDPILANGFD